MFPLFLKKFIRDSIVELRQSRDGFFLMVFNGRYLLDDTIEIVIRMLQEELELRRLKRKPEGKNNEANNKCP